MIHRLVEKPDEIVEVQETSFSLDALGRYICNSWDEAVNNGGPPFDAVVVGAGMFGAYCAEKIYREGAGENVRVLVLDAGQFLVSEHVQNLTRMGLNVAGATAVDPGRPRERVWGLPWRSRVAFPGLAYCVGGRSLYWGGWAPRLTPADLVSWPVEVSNNLRNTYDSVEREIGVQPSTDFITGDLYQELVRAFRAARPSVPTVDAIEEAPLAVQGAAPASGLFSFDKYSSAPLLIAAIREAAGSPDSSRRLFLVPRVHVGRLRASGGLITEIEAYVNGERRLLSIAPNCMVVLALGTIESTRLALESFPTPLMGRNLMGHLRSNTTVRIKRSALSPSLPRNLEAAALFVRGSTPQGRYHIQVTAAAVMGANPESVMFYTIPDIDLLDQMLSSQSADWIVITLRGIGEMKGNKAGTPPDSSWIDLSPYERDEFEMRRAWVNLVAASEEMQLWRAMDDAALALAQKTAGHPDNIEYFYDGAWRKSTPPASNDPNDPSNKVRDKLGTTHHEAGTLWMGEDPASSVTDLSGRFHHLANGYAAGPSLFPAIGSANPSLTAFVLARRTANTIVKEMTTSVEPEFRPLFTGTLAGWQMAGFGTFKLVWRNILETEGGIGLLWYTQEEFSDFLLKLDWRVLSLDDNSGVFVRFPFLGSSDPANDWRLAVDQGYEVQIDERGFDPETNSFGSPLHRTGSIYKLAPSMRQVSRPIGQWNSFEIEARGDRVTVLLNGELVSRLSGDLGRPLKGHIGFQNHHAGSQVQFRNIRLKDL